MFSSEGLLLIGCATVATIVIFELVRRKGKMGSLLCTAEAAAQNVVTEARTKATHENATIITPGSQAQTGVKLRNLLDQYRDGGLTFKQMRRIQYGLFVFSPERLIPPTEDNESVHSTEFDYSSDMKLFCRAYWPRALRNYPLGKIESDEGPQPVYTVEALPDDTHTYEFLCFCYIDGKPLVGPNSIENSWWREEGHRASDDHEDYWIHKQSREWNLLGDDSSSGGIPNGANKVLEEAFSQLSTGEHRIGFELCFRVLPLPSAVDTPFFPSKPTPISFPISVGEFNLLVKK